MSFDPTALRELLAGIRGRREVVLGDLVADEFIYVEMKRVFGHVADQEV